MSIKPTHSDFDEIKENPLTFSKFNYGTNSSSPFPPPPNSFMITEITEDFMITEGGDFMVTEF